MSISTSCGISRGQGIDNAYLWVTSENRVHVQRLPFRRRQERDRLQLAKENLDVLGLAVLNGADYHVLATFVTPTGFVEHAVGLTDAG